MTYKKNLKCKKKQKENVFSSSRWKLNKILLLLHAMHTMNTNVNISLIYLHLIIFY